MSDTKLASRRGFLRLAALGAFGTAILSACAATPAATPTTAPAAQPTAVPKAAEPTKPAAAAQPTTAAKSSGQEITLRVHARSGVEDEMFNNILPKFEAANPGVKVTQEVFPGAEYPQKLQTLAAGGTIGDVLQAFTNSAMYQQFFVSGILAEIDSRIKGDNVKLDQWYKYSIEACVVDGKTGGLPFKSHPSRVGLFYNVTLFEKAGLTVPDLEWNYDKLTETAVKIHKPPDAYGFSHPWHDVAYYPIMSRMFGGDFFTKDGKTTEIEKPEAQQGWTWHYDMMNKHKVTLNPLQTAPTPQDLFVSGKLAMFRANVGTKAAFAKIADFKWSMTLAPKGPKGNRGSLAETDVEAITKTSKAQDQAWALLKVLTSKETGIALAQQTGNRSSTPGGRPDVYESTEHLNLPYPEGVQKTSLKAMNEAEEWRAAANFRGLEVQRLADELSDLLLLDKEKPNAAFFARLKSEVQVILDKPRP